MDWKLVGDVAFYTTAIVTLLFSLLYLTLAPWWQSVGGRNTMAVMGSMALAFAYFSWAIAVGGKPPVFFEVRALLFMFIGAAIGWRTVIFIRHHLLRSLRGQTPEKRGGSSELEDAR